MVVITSTDLCIFCNQRKGIYYCEDCKISFCEDCGYSDRRTVYQCGQCQSNNIECRQRNSVNGELYICKDCGSLDIEAILEIGRNCPSCRSSKISSVAKKKLVLMKQLRDVISGYKFGYQELKAFLRDYRAVRQKTVALRAVGYLHDPIIEQTLLSVYETIKNASNDILERATQEIDLFRIQMEKFYNYSNWTPADFPQIELFIRQINDDMADYQKYVQKLLSQPKKEQGLVQSKLNVIRYYKSIYDQYTEFLNLFPGELPVCAFRDVKFSKSTIRSLRRGKGILFLTDQRLIFIRKSGILRKKVQRVLNFSYNHVLDVSIYGRLFKKLIFILDQGNLIFSASKRMMEAILDYLKISVNFGKYRINNGNLLNTLDQIQVSTKNLERQIDKKIVQLMAGTTKDLELDITPKEELFLGNHNNFYNSQPVLNTNRIIIKLQTEKYSIEQTIQNLEKKFQTGGIVPETYLRQFRQLQSELFLVEKKLASFENQIF
ncbi:MAG: hypothetical protein ACTSRC_03025 [Candidatus Helarchaeota archaeon]